MTDDVTDDMTDILLRPLLPGTVSRLAEIRPTYTAPSVLRVERTGQGVSTNWRLVEHTLPVPFDKGNLYDFTPDVQEEIRARMAHGGFQRLALDGDRVVGFVEVELHTWNRTAFLWNLMIDLDYRRRGLGSRLWEAALAYADAEGVRALMIETQNTNLPACRFYEAKGCHLVGLNEALYTNYTSYTSDTRDGQASEVALFWAYYFPTAP